MSDKFPEIGIRVDGAKVNAKTHIEAGTDLAVFGAFFIAIVGTLVGIHERRQG